MDSLTKRLYRECLHCTEYDYDTYDDEEICHVFGENIFIACGKCNGRFFNGYGD